MKRAEIKQVLDSFSEVYKCIHQRSYHSLEALNLYPGQPKFLTLIKANEGVTQKELSELHFVAPATITGMLNKLEANKYVYRVPDENDKRVMRVFLTPEGRELAVQGEKFMVDLTERMFQDFTEEELQTFLRLTNKITSGLNKQ